MPVCLGVHRLKDFDAWFEVFKSNPPPAIGRWRVFRGSDDRNRVHVVCEAEASQVAEIKSFLASDEMQAVFKEVNAMSTAPLEFVWLDDVTP